MNKIRKPPAVQVRFKRGVKLKRGGFTCFDERSLALKYPRKPLTRANFVYLSYFHPPPTNSTQKYLSHQLALEFKNEYIAKSMSRNIGVDNSSELCGLQTSSSSFPLPNDLFHPGKVYKTLETVQP
ncbi:hypothetical protein TNCV_4120931 [Trichonephila clavipes]|nr:hypothetical protein TNCV_4120931 [Trichonephila clavipes]